MKIAIDCADLDFSRIDGTRVYIKNVLNHLGDLAPGDDFLLFHQKSFNPELQPKKFPNYHDRLIPYPLFWTQTRLAFELLKEKPAVCWMPIQQAPFLVKGKIRTVFTAHDLAFKIYPECFEKKSLWKLNFFIDSAVRIADGIIAVSQSTKNDLLKFYPTLDEKKIKVIYHGFDQEQFSFPLDEEKANRFLKKHQLEEKKFLLYAGAIQPRKNLSLLIDAFEKIKKQGNVDLKLVLAGAPAWLAEGIVKKAKNSIFAKDIVLTGGISFEEMRILYRKAVMLVYPSLYEGFGLPILEAWASDLPVISSDNSSLSEIGGTGVEKFSTFSSDELTAKIQELLNNEDKRIKLVSFGRIELEKYSWRKCAQETLDYLVEIAKKNA